MAEPGEHGSLPRELRFNPALDISTNIGINKVLETTKLSLQIFGEKGRMQLFFWSAVDLRLTDFLKNAAKSHMTSRWENAMTLKETPKIYFGHFALPINPNAQS